MERIQRAVDWLLDTADPTDEGDGIGRALAVVLANWRETELNTGQVINLSAFRFDEELASAEAADLSSRGGGDEGRDV